VTDTNLFRLSETGTLPIRLTEGLRNGARARLAQAIEAEVEALLSRQADELTDDGRQRLVRHGHLPERELMTGIGVLQMRALECFGFSGNPKPLYGENLGEGTDAVFATVSQTLAANLETLVLQAPANLTGTGNGFDNKLFGNADENTLSGRAGNDLIDVGACAAAALTSPTASAISADLAKEVPDLAIKAHRTLVVDFDVGLRKP
jgi:hypothetical protein